MKIGQKNQLKIVVSKSDTAKSVGSGVLDVLAGNRVLLGGYKERYDKYLSLQRELAERRKALEAAKRDEESIQ